MELDVTSFILKRIVRSFLRQDYALAEKTVHTDIPINVDTGPKENAGGKKPVFFNIKLLTWQRRMTVLMMIMKM